MANWTLFTVEELRQMRHRAQQLSYGFTDPMFVRFHEHLADAAGALEALLNCYQEKGKE